MLQWCRTRAEGSEASPPPGLGRLIRAWMAHHSGAWRGRVGTALAIRRFGRSGGVLGPASLAASSVKTIVLRRTFQFFADLHSVVSVAVLSVGNAPLIHARAGFFPVGKD